MAAAHRTLCHWSDGLNRLSALTLIQRSPGRQALELQQERPQS